MHSISIRPFNELLTKHCNAHGYVEKMALRCKTAIFFQNLKNFSYSKFKTKTQSTLNSSNKAGNETNDAAYSIISKRLENITGAAETKPHATEKTM